VWQKVNIASILLLPTEIISAVQRPILPVNILFDSLKLYFQFIKSYNGEKNNFTPMDSLPKGIHIGVYTLKFEIQNKKDILPFQNTKVNRNEFIFMNFYNTLLYTLSGPPCLHPHA